MNVTLKQFQAFVEVARQGNFTRAAKRLLISQPALTVTVKELEDELGVRLFDRTTRRVQLTDDGVNFLPVAERLLNDIQAALDDVRAVAEHRRGRIGLAALPSVAVDVLPAVLVAYSHAYPGISIHLHDANASGVQAWVRRKEVDFGIGSQWQQDSELDFMPLFSDRFGLVCRSDHPLARECGPLTWDALEGYTFLGLAADTGIRPLLQTVETLNAELLAPKYEVSNIATLDGLLAAGLGITALPRLAVPRTPKANYVFRELREPVLERQICIITRRGRSLAPAAQSLVDMIVAMVGEGTAPSIAPV